MNFRGLAEAESERHWVLRISERWMTQQRVAVFLVEKFEEVSPWKETERIEDSFVEKKEEKEESCVYLDWSEFEEKQHVKFAVNICFIIWESIWRDLCDNGSALQSIGQIRRQKMMAVF